MTLYIYVREKKLYDHRFGEKNKLPIPPPPPPTFSKVKWLAPYVSYCKMISNY